jgi:hypothetical protein
MIGYVDICHYLSLSHVLSVGSAYLVANLGEQVTIEFYKHFTKVKREKVPFHLWENTDSATKGNYTDY